MKNYLDIIKKSTLFRGIHEAEMESLLQCLEAKKIEFGKHEYILRVGENAASLGLLLTGSACIVHEDFWGNRNIMAKVIPGQVFAEAFACANSKVLNVSVAAEQPCNVLFLSVRHILGPCSNACDFHGRILRNLLADLAGKNLRFNEKLTHMSQRSTRDKLLSYLSAESLKRGSPAFDIPYNRQQLADYLSVDRSAMSNELSKLRDEGILNYNRSHFELNATGSDKNI